MQNDDFDTDDFRPLMAAAAAEEDVDGTGLPPHQPIAQWLYSAPKSASALWLSRAGYVSGLLSSIFMVFLGESFAERLDLPLWLAYSLSSFSAVPLSVLLAQNVQKVTLVTLSPAPENSENILNAPTTLEKGLYFPKQALFLLLALTPSIPITYLSHIELMKNTGILPLAIFFDVFALLPRTVLFRWALQNTVNRLITLFKPKPKNRDANTLSMGVVAVHLFKINAILDSLGDQHLKQIASDLNTASSIEEKLRKLFSLPSQHPTLAKQTPKAINILSNILALLVGAITSYVIVPLAKNSYKAIWTAMEINDSKAINILSEVAAWTGAVAFTGLIYSAVTISFLRLYLTAIRYKNNRSTTARPTLDSSNESGCKHLIPPALILFAVILTFISVFPRIEINDEVITGLPEKILTVLDIVSGIGFFALDFWPVSDTVSRLARLENTREGIRLPVTKLLMNLGKFKPAPIKTLETLATTPSVVTATS